MISIFFLIPFVLSSEGTQETELDSGVIEYRALRTLKKPIRVFSGIGLGLCAGVWAWIRFVGV